ncbi:MAG: bifunctional phosphoribosylaminoimidazolecarboxamide formyltransferase/IMP cyclohydrolase [Bradymonadaceae bacterium]|nr:bifunctional phosphoribosylaminoimidazolecarboxamide formyltransferase/IMP cyclohydrolase [Lujinxingiaceae bacterium]
MSQQTTSFALVSVSDKTGIVAFAKRLSAAGFGIISTGGTAKHLREGGVEVVGVSDVTGFDEILDGRVKTLHPRIHAALLADRGNAEHVATLEAQAIANITMVVVNLYPFTQVVSAGTDWATAVETIDIGGPTMLRAAAKNHGSLTVVVDPADFERVGQAVEQGGPTLALRQQLAFKAFRHTATYDAAIVRYFEARLEADGAETGADEVLPARLSLDLERTDVLRYGENPHQQAALYQARGEQAFGGMEKLHGKELSYNNIVDLDAALELVWEFDEPAAAIIKHTNPAGCARALTLEDAYSWALQSDPISAFGGIVALNRPVSEQLAERLNEHFFEIIAAPDFEPAALALLTEKKNIRLMRWSSPSQRQRLVRTTALGYLAQSADPRIVLDLSGLESPTKRKPTASELDELLFAWKVCKHVKSNAIVLALRGRTLGVGAGQMSRVDSVELAVKKCATSPAGSVLASDAFFPFRDGVDAAARAGIRAIIQPGGSKRDDEIIAACDASDIAMVFTAKRHFRH